MNEMRIVSTEEKQPKQLALKEMLNKMGHGVFFIAQEELCKTGVPEDADLILLNAEKDHQKSLNTLSRLRRRQRDEKKECYIIFMASRNTPEDAMVALKAGADDFLSMPIDEKTFSSRIRVAEEMQDKIIKDEKYLEYNVVQGLLEEHTILRCLMDILERMAKKPEETPDEVLRWAGDATLMLDYALHHTKEELYFQTLVERLVETQGDWVTDLSKVSFTRLEDEHRRLEKMHGNIQDYLQLYLGNREWTQELVLEIKDYVDMLRVHMALEEKTFFPFAEKYLLETDRQRLAEEFIQLHKETGREAIGKKVEQVLKLCRTLSR
ncbi:MAG: hemerythrin domain-containing protein [Candidatus Thermoplasmatota archaeon]|nr:hemerythrin domain-containing protein [Candidatus Thermoplasmatota archaeon]